MEGPFKPVVLDTSERVVLIGALCDKLKWGYSHGFTRAEHLQIALRLKELCQSLPEEGDSA